MHSALEHQFEHATSRDCIEFICEKYDKFRRPHLINTRERDILDTLLAAARVTFPEYCKFWQDDDSHIDWIKRESQFDVPYDVMTPGGVRTIRLRGMRDGLFRLPGKNTLGVFETKNKSRISEGEIRDGLQSDMQTMFYMNATHLETGEIPRLVVYNIIRREVKKQTSETIKQFSTRLLADIKKRPKFYFIRFSVSVLPQELREFVQYNLNPLLNEFIWWWDNVKKNPVGKGRFQSPYHYRNSNALQTKYGKADVWPIIVHNNRRNFSIRSEPFPELANSFLDI